MCRQQGKGIEDKERFKENNANRDKGALHST
jgi:hypothetical protein